MIICAVEYIASPDMLRHVKPHVLIFSHSNEVESHFIYNVEGDSDVGYSFDINDVTLT